MEVYNVDWGAIIMILLFAIPLISKSIHVIWKECKAIQKERNEDKFEKAGYYNTGTKEE